MWQKGLRLVDARDAKVRMKATALNRVVQNRVVGRDPLVDEALDVIWLPHHPFDHTMHPAEVPQVKVRLAYRVGLSTRPANAGAQARTALALLESVGWKIRCLQRFLAEAADNDVH